MASKTPFVRQTSIVGLIPLIVAYVAAMLVSERLGHDGFWGILAVIGLFIGLRFTVSSDHRKGIACVRRRDFAAAIPHFEASYAFFDRRVWLDRFRSVFLLSPSGVTYREMALVNIAFSHAQLGDGENAIRWYERALLEYPESAIATSALSMMRAAERVGRGAASPPDSRSDE